MLGRYNNIKSVALFALMLSLPLVALAIESVESYIKRIQEKEAIFDEEAAFVIAMESVRAHPKSVNLLIMTSMLASKTGQRQVNNTNRKATFNIAKNMASAALKLEPNNAKCNLAMAIAMGRLALVSGLTDKVHISRDIEKYSSRAVQLDPNLAMAWHVLGKYNFEVSQLSSFEREAARKLMGGLPKASMSEAIRCFEKCYSLDKTYITNMLDLAKAYINQKRNADAKRVLTEIDAAPRKTTDDLAFKAEAKKLLSSLK